jgi:hypothetical protein
MTISIALKVGDGVILGADSASTMVAAGGIANVYFNAEKVFNLVKGLPIGVVIAGLGGLSGRSITSLSRDLRVRISSTTKKEWRLDKRDYSIEQAASLLRRFFFDEHYAPQFAGQADASPQPGLSFLVAGYSAGAAMSEVWAVEVDQSGNCPSPKLVIPKEVSGTAQWRGQPEALNRLVNGWSTGVHQRLVSAGMTPEESLALLSSAENLPLIAEGMPLQDAIDLVHYLIDVTAGFVRFAPGAPTVAPPTDSAAITKHEGFRWVRRKHYFSQELNRPIDRHAV